VASSKRDDVPPDAPISRLTWRTRDGRVIPPHEMSDAHVARAVLRVAPKTVSNPRGRHTLAGMAILIWGEAARRGIDVEWAVAVDDDGLHWWEVEHTDVLHDKENLGLEQYSKRGWFGIDEETRAGVRARCAALRRGAAAETPGDIEVTQWMVGARKAGAATFLHRLNKEPK
jgi:hypothetical protein